MLKGRAVAALPSSCGIPYPLEVGKILIAGRNRLLGMLFSGERLRPGLALFPAGAWSLNKRLLVRKRTSGRGKFARLLPGTPLLASSSL